MDRYVSVCAIVLLIGSTGCSSSNEPTAAPSTPAAPKEGDPSAASVQPNPTLGATPDKAVAEFLEAIRSGNDEQAAAMLTPMARQKTAEVNLAVAPPGSPTATFTVGKVEYVTENKDGAHVLSAWTDVNAENQKRTDEIIWVLRKEAEGWRIVGSVMKVFPDKDPLVLNYEDPQDMQRKLEMIYEEDAKETQPSPNNAQPQAKATGTNPPAVR